MELQTGLHVILKLTALSPGDKSYNATLFKDGVNAHRNGRDYKCESFPVKKGGKLKVHLAPGGGFALKIK